MVDSNRLKKRAREYMAENPGMKYQQALSAVRAEDANSARDGQPGWGALMGGVPASPDALAAVWARSESDTSLRAPIGLTYTRAGGAADAGTREKWDPIWLDLVTEGQSAPGGLLAIAGTTGTGKSLALKRFLAGLALRYSPNRVQFALYSSAGDLVDAIADLPHTAAAWGRLSGENAKSAAALCRDIDDEMHSRKWILDKHGAEDVAQYRVLASAGNTPTLPELPELVVAFDVGWSLDVGLGEWREQPFRESLYRAEIQKTVHRVLQQGRALGMHVIWCSDALLPPPLLAGFATRLCLPVHSTSTEQAMVGDDLAGLQRAEDREPQNERMRAPGADRTAAPAAAGRAFSRGCARIVGWGTGVGAETPMDAVTFGPAEKHDSEYQAALQVLSSIPRPERQTESGVARRAPGSTPGVSTAYLPVLSRGLGDEPITHPEPDGRDT